MRLTGTKICRFVCLNKVLRTTWASASGRSTSTMRTPRQSLSSRMPGKESRRGAAAPLYPRDPWAAFVSALTEYPNFPQQISSSCLRRIRRTIHKHRAAVTLSERLRLSGVRPQSWALYSLVSAAACEPDVQSGYWCYYTRKTLTRISASPRRKIMLLTRDALKESRGNHLPNSLQQRALSATPQDRKRNTLS